MTMLMMMDHDGWRADIATGIGIIKGEGQIVKTGQPRTAAIDQAALVGHGYRNGVGTV